jgi:hypothetical protein
VSVLIASRRVAATVKVARAQAATMLDRLECLVGGRAPSHDTQPHESAWRVLTLVPYRAAPLAASVVGGTIGRIFVLCCCVRWQSPAIV